MIKLCYSGKYSYEEMRRKIRGRGGMYAHLVTSDCRGIEQMIRDGLVDEVFRLKEMGYTRDLVSMQ